MLLLLLLFSCSVLSNSDIPWTTVLQASLSFTVSNSCPLSRQCYASTSSSVSTFLFYLQSFPASGSFPMSRLFTSGGPSIGALVSASLSKEYSGLISLRINWFDLLAVQETVKSLLQHHTSKALILQHSAFFFFFLFIYFYQHSAFFMGQPHICT